MANKKQQIKKSPKFLAYIDTSSLKKYEPTEDMIEDQSSWGLPPTYYVELKAQDIIGAIEEASQYKTESVYLVDILQRLDECDEFGYVNYKHVLRCRSHGFYSIKEEFSEDWFRAYNPDYRTLD